jgi:hypothetical protein
MKTITQKLIKGLLVIVLFTGVSVALSSTGVQIVSEAHAGVGTGVTEGQAGQGGAVTTASSVSQYLLNSGYNNVFNVYKIGVNKWKASVSLANGDQGAVIVNTASGQILTSNEQSI